MRGMRVFSYHFCYLFDESLMEVSIYKCLNYKSKIHGFPLQSKLEVAIKNVELILPPARSEALVEVNSLRLSLVILI